MRLSIRYDYYYACSMLNDPPTRKKKIILHAHRSRPNSELPSRQETARFIDNPPEEVRISDGLTANNNSLEIYEDDRRDCLLFMSQTEEEKDQHQCRRQVEPKIMKEREFSTVQSQTMLFKSKELPKTDSQQKLISFGRIQNISHSHQNSRILQMKPHLASPNKRFLQITLKNTLKDSSSSQSLLKNKENSFYSRGAVKEKGMNDRKSSLVELTSSSFNYSLIRRTKADKPRLLAITSHKYGTTLFDRRERPALNKCSSILVLKTVK